ncbi:MAG: carboxypeptidase regulatory-like domain-containing protein [Planctomycetaceae bacterium]|nr:carboxypeptidase regulatory-like domain-containing protein [Planctomycetaceae bacterium]
MSWFDYESNHAALSRTYAEVSLEGHLSNKTVRSNCSSSATGAFQLEGLPNDRWVVLAIEADGYLPKCIVADTGNDPALESAADAPRFFDEGTIRLKRATKVELVVVAKDGGIPIRLKTAFASPVSTLQTSDPLTERALELRVEGNRALLPVLPPRRMRFWLIPELDSEHVPASVDVDGSETTDNPKRVTIEVTRGARVSGRVIDAVTNRPIADADIHYEPESMADFAEYEASVPSVRSNKDGEFTMIVPAIDAWLRQIGRVDGYRSAYMDFNRDIRPVLPSERISPRLGGEIDVKFCLQPAPRVIGQVLDSQGNAVPHACYASRERVTQSGFRHEIGVTDAQGHFELKNIFAELLLDPPQGDPRAPEEPARETILFWSPQRDQTATVQVDYPEKNQPDLNLNVMLNPASTISGRVVNKDSGIGIADVNVALLNGGLGFPATLGFSSKSDTLGNFTVRPVFANSRCHLKVAGDFIGANGNSSEWIVVPPMTQYRIGEIPVFVYRDLEKLLEIPDLSQLTEEQAYGALKSSLASVQQRSEEVEAWQQGRSSEDTVSKARLTATEKFGEAILKLSRRTQNDDLVYQGMMDYFATIDSFSTHSFFANRVRQAFLERFLNRENIAHDLPKVLSEQDKIHWQFAYDNAKTTKSKRLPANTWHLSHSALCLFWRLGKVSRTSSLAKNFRKPKNYGVFFPVNVQNKVLSTTLFKNR